MKYPILLFDLDDTILDTKTNAEKALKKMSSIVDFPFNQQQLLYWHQLNDKLWEKFEKKELTRDELLILRFKLYFDHFNKKVDAKKFNQTYLRLLKEEITLIPSAKEVISNLSQTRRIFAVSNGTKEKQFSQLSQAHLIDNFEKLFLSEDIGYQKPDPNFFKVVLDDLDVDKSETLVIGDSLTADISGANLSNIDSVWFNPTENNNKTDFKPTFEIKNLPQLEKILN
ncbi:YjjG family noncanonical pyrimidine nucleotidase [Companilactobacillus halodurans]|uniref:Noncanonical pyrimidine nucleotidase, YjjG family n=1 Tax=Companilactobacillus halodurans TaxID=2584183 RepID=A0A5P0ZLW7_9LACO|nr:YjjG family noncanonical pyrimidine nucleotidase [Companilactobacillus halodurans]MQS75207.1 noncanonical pyrimidine nucleotidase, YjjG family [Companilactobacillus halodurans]MQS98531.1 noncanonical pyrimidine nucleotidase, YjjG family [Companilactobacillus halodurans]